MADAPPGTLAIGQSSAPGIHPALQAAQLHYNLVAIHTFADGNGRTARLMMNHHLLRHAYPYSIIELNRRTDYLDALDEANHGRTERIARHMLQSIRRSVEILLIE